jgi:hypothetical protein
MEERKVTKLTERIRYIIRHGFDIHLKISQLDEWSTKKIETTACQLALHYKRRDLHELMAVAIKECTENGIKANLKRLYFSQQNLDIHKEKDYHQGIAHFKERLKKEHSLQSFPVARQAGYLVLIDISHSQEGISIDVINNAGVSPMEAQRMRERYHKGKDNTSFAEFLKNQIDPVEGAGIGIALILAILGKLKVQAGDFALFGNKDKTIAHLSFPLTQGFVDYGKKRLQESYNLIAGER